MWLKRILSVTLLTSFMILLSACGDDRNAGVIKNWDMQGNVLSWDSVDNAAYYELHFYDPNDPDHMIQSSAISYAYTSEYSFDKVESNTEVYTKITVHYKDDTTKDSTMIHFMLEREFPYPVHVGGNYIATNLTWDDMSTIKGFINYTLRIDGKDYIAETNSYDLSNLSAGVHKIYVRVNYLGGSSDFTPVYYYTSNLNSDTLILYYDMTQDVHLDYTFPDGESILYVTGNDGIYSNIVLPDIIASHLDNVLSINGYYIHNQASTGDYILSLRVVTNSTVYLVLLTENPDLVTPQ